MLKNNLKIAFRNLWKNKFQSFILVFGLALGLAVAFFIGKYIQSERSYDQFHSKVDRIYRVPLTFYKDGVMLVKDAMNTAPSGPTLKAEFPEVEQFVRFSPEYSKVIFKYEEKQFQQEKVYYTDSTLFEVFDFALIQGDPNTCLNRPFTTLLTKSTAEQYFGKVENWTESPIGKSLKMNNQLEFEITGILEDVPENSHIQFNALLSFVTFPILSDDPANEWQWNDFWTYILLKEGTEIEQFATKIPDFNERHEPNKDSNRSQASDLQALADIHLHSNISYEWGINGDSKTIKFLFLIGIAILMIAWANYINLATARAEDRAMEIGVRKVVGATKKSLVFQFLSEALLVNALAISFAAILVKIGQGGMNWVVGKSLPSFLSPLQLLYILPIILLIGTFLSGLYPAFFLSTFSPKRALRKESRKKGKEFLRKGLVVFQYGISVILLIGTMMIYLQLDFMRNQDLGFSLDQKLILKAPSKVDHATDFEKYQSFKNEMLSFSEVQQVAGSSAIPGKNYLDLDSHGGIRLLSAGEEKNSSLTAFYADEGFVEAYDVDVIAGRNFSAEMKTDNNAVLITESALKLLELEKPEDAIGKMLRYQGEKQIVGVIADYHQKSLRHAYEPTIIRNWRNNFLYLTIQLKPENFSNLKDLVSKVKSTWEKRYPNDPFDYFFLDEHFNEQYLAEQRLGYIFMIFSFFAIFIACLGLFGLASYMVTIRTKEIGVRKVLGASVTSIVNLLSRDFLGLVVIALVIASPVAWYIMHNWLEGFAYSIDMKWWVFALAGFLAIGIAFLTVSVQSVKAALVNPLKSLRNE